MRKNLLHVFWTFLTLVGIFCSSVSYGQATKKHSYTFEEGTYEGTMLYDQTGSLDGTLVGDKISIADGKVTVEGSTSNIDGYISFDAVDLAMHTYNAVTIEAYLETFDGANAGYTMLCYFGNNTGGSRSFWFQPTINGSASRAAVDNTSPVAQLDGVECDDGLMHHVAAVLTKDDLKYYLDGVLVAEVTTAGVDYISTIDTVIAHIFKGPDGWADDNYNVNLLEFNIFDGELDQATIALNAGQYLGLDLYNASLDTLTTDIGTWDLPFDSETDLYEVTVPYGTTSIMLSAKPTVGGAGVTYYDGLGAEHANGVITFDKEVGDDITVEVTAIDGNTTQEYYVSVFTTAPESSATLEDIELSAGHLTEDFMMDDISYIAIVPNGTATVDITGVPNWAGATVSGGGTITLTDGMGSVTLTVTSEDATATMEYTIQIFESIVTTGIDYYLVHEMNGFVATEKEDPTLNQIVLAEAVVDSSAQIWQFVESGEEGQFFIMNKLGNYMCLSRNGASYDMEVYSDSDLPTSLDSALFILNEFEQNRFKIISVARQQVSATSNMVAPNDGLIGSALYSDKYPGSVWDNSGATIWNIKLASDTDVASPFDVHLSDLTMNGSPLVPVFDPAYTTYHTTIPAGVTSVEIAATPRDATATVTGTGTIDVSGGEGTITITVTASDPSYTRNYVIHYGGLSLKHSFTFEEGTYDATTVFDQIGSVDGTIGGDSITIADGKATVSGATSNSDGWISMDGKALALNTYSEITVEVMLEAGNQENASYTMLTYFGTSTPGNGCFWIQPSRSGNESRMETNNGNTTVNAVLGGYELDDGLKHHVVGILNSTSLKYYIDGELVAEGATDGMDFITTLGTDVANIFRGVDGWNDPNYNGSVYEYNIYEGQMDEATIMEHTVAFLGAVGRDASLSALTVNEGELLPAFDPEVSNYSVVVPDGTTVNVNAVPTDVNATVEGTGDYVASADSAVTATITVTAEDGARTKIYTIGFTTPGEYSLKHSYTFEEGAYLDTVVYDMVGDADAIMIGGTIAEGSYTAAANGDIIELPAADIAINTFTEVTLEGYIYSDVDNTGATMLAYFGGNENDLGGNGFFLTPDRWAESRTAISCGNVTAPWSAEQGITGVEVSMGEKHHVASVLTNSSIKWYVDGALIGEAEVSGDNSIANISTANAWLCKGGYTSDPSWQGSIAEFNIYEGVLDAATIAQHAKQYLEGLSYSLMHSYTFEDGTAKDVIGDADGTPMGAGTIADGVYTAAANGDYIELPAANIAINTYSAVTLEGYIFSGVDNPDAVMMAYFGGNEGGLGGNGYFLTPDRWNESRTAISCGNVSAPWEAEQGITSAPVSVGASHHVVSVLTDSLISWYIDGELMGSAEVSGDNAIANLSNANAWLCKGGYSNDPTWMGTIDEFNIYEGAMDAVTIAQNAKDYLGRRDASLSSLSVDLGVMGPEFNKDVTTYYVTIPEGTTLVTVTATPTVNGATVAGDGAIDVSSGSVNADVTVTAADGSSTMTYTILFSTPGEFTLMHSYPFEDGTANDVVGTLHGTVNGMVTITEGKATVDPAANGQGQNYGYISFDGTALALNAYSSITTEAFIVAGDGTNDWYTMLYYFGDDAANFLFSQMTQGDSDANVKTITTAGEAAAYNGGIIDDGMKHHVVATITANTLKFYVDGVLMGASAGEGFITPIGMQFAHLFRGPDAWNDDAWIGSFEEFNIWEGEMDAATVAERYNDFTTGIATEVIDEDAFIKVYPTYSNGDFTVETNGNRGMIQVYNLVGKLVLQKTIESTQEKVNVQNDGMYIMKVESEGSIKTFKVFKTR